MKLIICIALILALAAAYTTGQDCKCNDGEYFRPQNGKIASKCLDYPDSKKQTKATHKFVKNCKFYTHDGTKTQCTACEDKFWLKEDQTCNAVTIKNCANQTDSKTCASCEQHFLKADLETDTCTAIASDKKIKDCANYSNATTCSACIEKKELGKTDGKCHSEISGCSTYISADKGVKCSACKNTHGFKQSDSTCVPLTKVTGCTTYNFSNTGASSCSACEAEYYVFGGKCLKKNTNAKGVTYNGAGCAEFELKTGSTSDTQCVKCKADSKNHYFLQGNACVEITAEKVTNCIMYSSVTECSKCGGDFYLAAVKTKAGGCTAYPTAGGDFKENCTEYILDGGNIKCTACKYSTHYLNTAANGSCVANPISTAAGYDKNCGKYVNDTGNTCELCVDNYNFNNANPKKCITNAGNKLCDYTFNGTNSYDCMCKKTDFVNYLFSNDCLVCPSYKKKDDGKKDNKKEDKDEDDSASVISVGFGMFIVTLIAIL